MFKKIVSILIFSLLAWEIVPLDVHWTPKDSTDGWLRPNKLFVVICENQQTGEKSMILNLSQLANIKNSSSNHPCADKNASFHLKQLSGKNTFDDFDYSEISYQVTTGNQNNQVIEINYTGDNILSAWFKYEVKNNGDIIPLESRVRSTFHILSLIFFMIIILSFSVFLFKKK